MTDDELDPTLVELVDAARAVVATSETYSILCSHAPCTDPTCRATRRLAAALAPYADEVTE